MELKTLFLLILSLVTFFSCKDSSESVFTDKTYQDTIKQNIGGFLIRNIHYSNDFQSGIYEIKYSFKDILGNRNFIGTGSFYSQQPPENEQLIQYDKWTIFKTSGDRHRDLLFICDNASKVGQNIQYHLNQLRKQIYGMSKTLNLKLAIGRRLQKLIK